MAAAKELFRICGFAKTTMTILTGKLKVSNAILY